MGTDTFNQAEYAATLAAWATGLTAPEVRLFTPDIYPDPTTPLASLVEPAGTWYAAIPAVYGDVYLDGQALRFTIQSVQFNYSGVSTPEAVFGYMVVDVRVGPVDHLLQARRLPAPVTMSSTLDALVIEPSVAFPAILAVQD